MSDNVRKISIALLILAGVWVAVYWLWEPGEGRISFSKRAGAGAAVVDQAGSELPPDPAITEPDEFASRPHPSGDGGGVRPSASQANDPMSSPGAKPAGSRPSQSNIAQPPVGPDGKPIAVMPPEFVDYTVRPGDTLATISLRVYGTRSFAAVVGKSNPFMDPNRLKPGRVIRVPKDPNNVQGKPLPRPEPSVEPKVAKGAETAGAGESKTYTVKPGDTLSGISQEFYGSSGLGTFLFESNRGVLKSPDELKVGMKLQIPPRPTADADGTGGSR